MKLFRKYDVKRYYYRAKLHFYNNEQEGHRLYQSLKQNKKKYIKINCFLRNWNKQNDAKLHNYDIAESNVLHI